MLKLLSKKLQKTLSLFLAAGLLFASGCTTTPKDITYYPTPDSINSSSASDIDVTDGEDEVTPDGEDEEEKELVFDSLRDTGVYVYEPTKLLINAENSVKGDALEEARLILKAIDNLDTTVSFEGLNADPNYVKLAVTIADYSNPIVSSVSIEPDEDETYRIIYQYDPGKQRELNDAFATKVTELINENVKPEYNDKQRAYAIYKYLVENIAVDTSEYDPSESTVNYSFITGYNREDKMVEDFVNGSASTFECLFMYVFLLNQLNIDSTIVGAYGEYKPQDITLMDAYFEEHQSWMWPIVKIDEDEYYHCDLASDMLLAYDDEIVGSNNSADIKYFGMSDKTNSEKLSVYYSADIMVINAAQPRTLPTCPDDMKDYDLD